MKKPAAVVKAPVAKLEGEFGCPKCRHSKTGCLKRNPEKTAKWLAKKEAKEKKEAEEAKGEAEAKKAAKKAKAKEDASKASGKDDTKVGKTEVTNDDDTNDDANGSGKWEALLDTEDILESNPDKEEGDEEVEGSLDEGATKTSECCFSDFGGPR